jgi:cobalamin synthase
MVDRAGARKRDRLTRDPQNCADSWLSRTRQTTLSHLRQPSRAGTSKLRYLSQEPMLWTIAIILIILYALGLVSGYALGGFIHIILVVAIIVIVIQLITGRRPL